MSSRSSRCPVPFTVQPWDDFPYYLDKPTDERRGISLDPFCTTSFAYQRDVIEKAREAGWEDLLSAEEGVGLFVDVVERLKAA